MKAFHDQSLVILWEVAIMRVRITVQAAAALCVVRAWVCVMITCAKAIRVDVCAKTAQNPSIPRAQLPVDAQASARVHDTNKASMPSHSRAY